MPKRQLSLEQQHDGYSLRGLLDYTLTQRAEKQRRNNRAGADRLTAIARILAGMLQAELPAREDPLQSYLDYLANTPRTKAA
jgi:hypothetical protein